MCPEQSVEDRSRAWETALENEGLVNKAAGEYVLKFDPRSGIDFEFLKSYGWEGLLRAVERFDPDYGTKFSTFAIPYIRGYMQVGVRTLLRQIGGDPRARAGSRIPQHFSFDDPDFAGSDVDRGRSQRWVNIESERIHLEEQQLQEEEEERAELFEDLHEAIDRLPEPGRKMLRLFYFGDGKERPTGPKHHRPGMTLREIAEVCGISYERVRQRISKSILTLQRELNREEVHGEQPW